MILMETPQIITYIQNSLDHNIFDVKWIPCSAKFVVLGGNPRSGALKVYELCHDNASLLKQVEKQDAFKCGTFGASSLHDRHLATGDFEGRLEIWNLDALDCPVYSVKAHSKIINAIDGIGEINGGGSAPQIVTGSRDGSVKIWDTRQEHLVATMEPALGEIRRDCWTVTFGHAHTSERVVCAGFDNGDIKLFDLRTMSVRWETNLKHGICCVEFDKKDTSMNKLVVTSLESNLYLYDMLIQHPKRGFPFLNEKAHESTIWTAKHLPQNTDIFMTTGGNGSLCLWKFSYLEKQVKESSGKSMCPGATGTLSQLQTSTVSQQPITSFDWSPDKEGLCVCSSFDKTFRVLIVTKVK